MRRFNSFMLRDESLFPSGASESELTGLIRVMRNSAGARPLVSASGVCVCVREAGSGGGARERERERE